MNLWAVVDGDAATASVVRGRGITTGTGSVNRTANGTFVLTFNQNVNTCAYVTTVGSPTAQTSPSDTRIGFAEPVPVTGQNAQVRVFTYDKGGSSGVNRDFTIAVYC